MPGTYTHVRIARAAANAARLEPAEPNAYLLGASGPDFLRVNSIWAREAAAERTQLAMTLHAQKCGAFLRALLFYAKTPAQRSYTLGFLTHYAVDTVMHPYLAALCAQGAPFADRLGTCEAALDAYFCKSDTGRRTVRTAALLPQTTPAARAEICALLRRCIHSVYAVDIPHATLSDTLHAFKHTQRRSVSRPGAKRFFVPLARAPKDGFPAAWTNPYTDRAYTDVGPNALCLYATKRAAALLCAAQQMWDGTLAPAACAKLVGDFNYHTGLPAEKAAE